MDFSFGSTPLLFAAIAALGLWLTWALYFRAPWPAEAGAPLKRGLLAFLAGAAWLALAWYGAEPLLRRTPAVYHPPAVVLALDASASSAALGARAAAKKAFEEARAHYEASGFKVIGLAFAERATSRGDDAGTLTSFAALARALDSLRVPNLQAVLLASDGRATLGAASGQGWPAPVHPLILEGVRAEAQGESATLDAARLEEGAELRVTWSAGAATQGVVIAEIEAGGRALWRGVLRAQGAPAAAAGMPVETEFRLPASLTRGARPETWTLRVRPEANPLRANDVVDLRVRGAGGPRDYVARPLSSLEERGLVDALRFSEGAGDEAAAVFVGDPSAVEPGAEDALWTRAGRAPTLSGAGAWGAVLEYRIASVEDSKGRGLFGPEARVHWREDGAEFLPAGVLRLGDLGLGEGKTLRLPPESRDAGAPEALAWAEEGGRKGLLLWRKPGARAFGIALPPLWSMAPPGDGARASSSRWTRGASAWARARGRVRVSLPDPAIAGRPFALEARFPAGNDGFKNIESYDLYQNDARLASARGRGFARFDSVALPAGTHALSVRRGSRVVWAGPARVVAPRDLELRKLGVDARGLEEIAAASNGNIIRHESLDEIPWPALPGGQAREARPRATSLAPAALALAIALLLCAAWGVRKRLQLD